MRSYRMPRTGTVMSKSDQVEQRGVEESALSDVLAPGLTVVFCGINPALAAFADGHNFSTPSNRFWRVLHGAGFTPRLLHHQQERELLCYGYGSRDAGDQKCRGGFQKRIHRGSAGAGSEGGGALSEQPRISRKNCLWRVKRDFPVILGRSAPEFRGRESVGDAKSQRPKSSI